MKTKMKQLFGILLSLALMLGLMPGMSLTALAEEEVDYLPTSAGAYKLKSNITVDHSSPVELGSGTISIDLAGHTITIEADGGYNNRTLFRITSGGTLTIKDSSSAGTGRITRNGTSSNDSVIWVDGGTLNWEGGIVSDVCTECGIIDVDNGGQFNMSGGSFTGNTLSNNGQGAVRLLSGTSFLRISGTPVITGNTGGNVYVSNGSKIEIIGALNSGAKISVNMQTPGVFTSEYGSYYNTGSSVSDPWNFFDSDDSENKWVLWNDGFSEARLGSKQDNPRKSATYTINYENETAIPKDGYEISTDRTTAADSPVNLTPILDAGGNPVIYIRKKGEGSQNPGEWVQISLTSRPDAPTGINPTDATNSTSADGTITGVNTAMEYSVDGTNWIAVSGTTITGLTPGTYYVRIKATETAPHGTPTKVKVGRSEIILQDNQKPTPKTDLIFNGSEQELLNKPSEPLPEGADEIQYAIGTDATTPPTSGWDTSIPARTDVGTYYVWYRFKGDLNHYDSEPRCVTVNIANALYTVTSVENWEHTIDYPNDIIITVKRNAADNITFSMYTGASVDGNGIPAGGSSVAQGSLILTLKGSYLDTLSTGTHKVTISFKDGSADASISIVNAPPAPTAAPTHVPKTGDGANLVLWIGLILLGFLGIIAFAGMAGRKHRNR